VWFISFFRFSFYLLFLFLFDCIRVSLCRQGGA
jgi:hypothetical protein